MSDKPLHSSSEFLRTKKGSERTNFGNQSHFNKQVFDILNIATIMRLLYNRIVFFLKKNVPRKTILVHKWLPILLNAFDSVL